MSNQKMAAQRQATGAGETGAAAEPEGNLRNTPEPGLSVATARLSGIWPSWLGMLLGRLILRICPAGKRACAHESCHLRAFCKCAQAEWTAAGALENRFWVALAICAVAVIVYCFFLR